MYDNEEDDEDAEVRAWELEQMMKGGGKKLSAAIQVSVWCSFFIICFFVFLFLFSFFCLFFYFVFVFGFFSSFLFFAFLVLFNDEGRRQDAQRRHTGVRFFVCFFVLFLF